MKLKVGIVGCGVIIEKHIAALKNIRDVELVAVCDLNKELARQVASKYGIKKSYSDFTALLDAEKPDVVHITTPPQTHLALGIQALRSGCHVLFEKPIALTVDEVSEIIEAATANNVNVSVVHHGLYLPAIRRARAIIQSSKIGELIEMQIIQTEKDTDKILDPTHWSHQLPGGIFGELVPHPLYLAEAFLSDLNLVNVHSRKLGNYEWLKVDEVRILLESSIGTATIVCSLNSPDIMLLNIIGTRGCLHVDVSRGAVITNYPSDRRFIKGLDNLRTSYQWLNATACAAFNYISGRYHDGHYYLIRSFIDALQNGSELPVSIEKAKKLTKLFQDVTSSIPRT
jgi:predicted dehydrogenase